MARLLMEDAEWSFLSHSLWAFVVEAGALGIIIGGVFWIVRTGSPWRIFPGR
ncbi:MAG: hypothetical protein L3J21_03945 [Devosiaceae bacterium]|nr:hypothetical protein [Devosiaceae bacterium]